MTKFAQNMPCGAFTLYHIPQIYLSVSRNRLLILLFQGLWVAREMIRPMIKGSCMSLDQNDVPTGIVKMVSTILYNLFCHLDRNSLGNISTWASEVLLCIIHYNYSIVILPVIGYWIHMKKPTLMVTGILCPSDFVKFPVIPWTFLNQSSNFRGNSPPRPQQKFIHSIM